ncbi:hypothetical protein J4234_04525 [Candidatus Woesearchaeota archaeon]|nr:hypothetical protein [Candidatus Woesearchaeota archaeon]
MPELKSENNILFGIALLLVILVSFAMLGLAGLRTMLGIIIVMFLPFYLILDNLGMEQREKIFFSFFISIILFPSLVYWLGFVAPFKISIFVIFAALLIAAYTIKKFSKRERQLFF